MSNTVPHKTLRMLCGMLETGWTLHVPSDTKLRPFVRVTVRVGDTEEQKVIEIDSDDVIDLFTYRKLIKKGSYATEDKVTVVAYALG
jgi:hypothetical protein